MIEYRKIFIDTAPFIYYLEQNPRYYAAIVSFLEQCFAERAFLFTSAVTVEEYCVFPYRNNNRNLIENFYHFIWDMNVKVISIDEMIADKAAQIRSEYQGFKAMDALQLASASMQNCQIFLTNDKQLKQFKEISCITMEEL